VRVAADSSSSGGRAMVYVVEAIGEWQRRMEVRPTLAEARELAKAWRGDAWFLWASCELFIYEGPAQGGPLAARERWSNDVFAGETHQQWEGSGRRVQG